MEIYVETHSLTSSQWTGELAGPSGAGWDGPTIQTHGAVLCACWTRAKAAARRKKKKPAK